MVIEYPEARDVERIDNSLPLKIKDLKSGEIYEARISNYSCNGIYFESDCVFQTGAKIYISLQDSPDSQIRGVLEFLYGEVIWRKDLKQSFLNYGYGVQLGSDSREHQRKNYFRDIPFYTHKGVFEGRTKNISARGSFIATDEKLDDGQLLSLKLPLKDGKMTEIIGRIVWLNEEGFGLKFQKVK